MIALLRRLLGRRPRLTLGLPARVDAPVAEATELASPAGDAVVMAQDQIDESHYPTDEDLLMRRAYHAGLSSVGPVDEEREAAVRLRLASRNAWQTPTRMAAFRASRAQRTEDLIKARESAANEEIVNALDHAMCRVGKLNAEVAQLTEEREYYLAQVLEANEALGKLGITDGDKVATRIRQLSSDREREVWKYQQQVYSANALLDAVKVPREGGRPKMPLALAERIQWLGRRLKKK